MEHYFKALQQAELNKNSKKMVLSAWGIGRCNYYLYDRAMALEWYKKALVFAAVHKLDSLLPRANYHVSSMFIEAENVDSSLKYSSLAIELAHKIKDFALVSQTYSTLAELHLNTTKDKLKIEDAISNAEKYAELANNPAMLAFATSKRYNYAFFMKKDYREALMHTNKAEKLYLETNNREAILNAYRGKAECLVMLKDTLARTYMLRWFEFKDSILQAEKAANIAKYETLYETQQRENEYQKLRQENELNSLKVQSQNRTLIIVISISLLAIATALYLLARNNLKKRQQELVLLQKLQQDKERIARDLHDNVGGQLSYIIYSLDGIHEEDPAQRKELTESIHQATKSVITSLRETIWAISDANISAHDFSDKLKVYARTQFKHSPTKVIFLDEIRIPKKLNALLGLNLYRMCQEILTNAFKHASAQHINLQFSSDEANLKITISDNGKGFDPGLKTSECYGLQNLKKRAEEFGIKVNLITAPGKGTTYELIV